MINDVLNTPGNSLSEIKSSGDVCKTRSVFDCLDKIKIVQELYREQHGLCAYCMRALRPVTTGVEKMSVEHYKPLSEDVAQAFNYSNFLGVCDGGETWDGTPKVLCCDKSRGEQDLTISPWNEHHMRAVMYDRYGRIKISDKAGLDNEEAEKISHDIDYVLKLNGILDEKGFIKQDTATHLVASRKRIIDRIYDRFTKLANRGNLDVEHIGDEIAKCRKAMLNEVEPLAFAGVWLYFLQKKQDKLCRRKN